MHSTTQIPAAKRQKIKTATISIALILFLGCSFNLFAQTTAVWQGGKPGRTNDWNCPANWSESRVPDEFTQVIIPAGATYYPVIQYAPTPIDALLMEGGTRLTIQNGARLAILGETGIFDGVTILGQIENNGRLEIGVALNREVAISKQVQGKGVIISPSAGMDTLARRR